MLGAAAHIGMQTDRLELALQLVEHVLHGGFALAALLRDAFGDVVIRIRVEIAQREIFEIPLHPPDAQAVRDRRVDLERLARDRLLLRRRQRRQRAHVVQAVGELDDDDADVLGHRQEHLAQVLDLRVFLRLIRDARQLGDAVDERGDLVAEARGDFFARDDRVFDDVVEQRGGDRRAVHLEIGQDRGDGERVLDVRLAGGPALLAMRALGDSVNTLEPRGIERGVVTADVLDEISDSHAIFVLQPAGSRIGCVST